MQREKPTALVWLRNDLRTQDQQSFILAKESGSPIVAHYNVASNCFVTTPWGFKKMGAQRTQL